MNTKYNVLVLGSGGREHALSWKIAKSNLLKNLHIAPGNAGTAHLGIQANLSVNDFEGIAKYCEKEGINIIVVGPEDPLVNGISDYFAEQMPNVFVFGPNKNAAQLEGSKDFSKQFMQRNGIPTAAHKTFNSNEIKEAQQFLETLKPPYVLKADGLAAGKGVLILNDIEEAKLEVLNMLQGKFGAASQTLVIEEFLDGLELSYFALTDGKNYLLLSEAKDYKRIGEGDTGLNTGGMGAISPVPFANNVFKQKVIDQIVEPTINGFKKEDLNYVGFIFFGLINVDGEPKVIEYNCRMGDPETEVVIPRLQSDLLEAIVLSKDKLLNEYEAEFSSTACTTVIAVSEGYPGSYSKGIDFKIAKPAPANGVYFYAGVKVEGHNEVTSGGRVVACTAWAENAQDALFWSYKMIDQVSFSGKHYRKDIGKDILK